MATIARERQSEIDEANASGKTPVIFIHGLWRHCSLATVGSE